MVSLCSSSSGKWAPLEPKNPTTYLDLESQAYATSVSDETRIVQQTLVKIDINFCLLLQV